MAGVKDKDYGYKKIVRKLTELDGMSVSAGVFKDAGREANGANIVDVAIWNEYGTKRIPARPFVHIASDENAQKWSDAAAECVEGVASGRMTKTTVGEKIGKQMQSDIRSVIGDKSKLAPNAPATIRKKGHDKPLIDTGKLQNAVNWRTED